MRAKKFKDQSPFCFPSFSAWKHNKTWLIISRRDEDNSPGDWNTSFDLLDYVNAIKIIHQLEWQLVTQ